MAYPFAVVLSMLALAAAPGLAGEVVDRTKAVSEPDSETLWYDLRELEVEGRGWTVMKAFFDRLPAKAEGVVRAPVWDLSRHSTGLCVRFVTDAPTILARWSTTSEQLASPHMPATGVSGLDLYVKHQGQWRWLGVGPPQQQHSRARLAAGLPPGEHEFLLYLPLYNGVSSVELGLPQTAKLSKAGAYGPGERKAIVFYGTSITQGGCASRPGMVHTAILGRRLGFPVINLGFSGNGTMDPEIAGLLAELDPAVYVIDCVPNMSADQVSQRTEPLVRTLREAHPETPILLVDARVFANAGIFAPAPPSPAVDHTPLREAYERLLSAGTRHLFYLAGTDLIGSDGEGTVDGSHPTDLGFMRQAGVFEAALRPLLSTSAPTRSGK